MDEQLDLLMDDKMTVGMIREKNFLANVMPLLKDTGSSRNADPHDITARTRESYSSIYFRSSLIARIRLRGKLHTLSIPDRLADAIPSGTPITKLASEKQFSRITFQESTAISILESATLLAIERVPKEFDCCSRYMQCSNANVCVHPDPKLSMLCGYRKILKTGRIFYGENRNID